MLKKRQNPVTKPKYHLKPEQNAQTHNMNLYSPHIRTYTYFLNPDSRSSSQGLNRCLEMMLSMKNRSHQPME